MRTELFPSRSWKGDLSAPDTKAEYRLTMQTPQTTMPFSRNPRGSTGRTLSSWLRSWTSSYFWARLSTMAVSRVWQRILGKVEKFDVVLLSRLGPRIRTLITFGGYYLIGLLTLLKSKMFLWWDRDNFGGSTVPCSFMLEYFTWAWIFCLNCQLDTI